MMARNIFRKIAGRYLNQNLLFMFVATFFSWTNSGLAIACPCGCGSVSTESLFPSEFGKISMGVSTLVKKNVFDSNGNKLEGDKTSENAITVNATFRVVQDLSLGLGIGYSFLKQDEAEEQVWLEPLLYLNYTALPYDVTSPAYPMILINLNYSPENDENFVVHRGYAYSQVKSSAWWTAGTHNFGLSLAARRNFPSQNDFNPSRKVDFGTLFEGSIGYTLIKVPLGQVGFDYGYAFNTKSSYDGMLQGGTNKRYDPVTVFLGARIKDKLNMRVEYASNYLWIAQNIVGRQNISISMSQTF